MVQNNNITGKKIPQGASNNLSTMPLSYKIDERFLPSDSQSNYDGESVRTKEDDTGSVIFDEENAFNKQAEYYINAGKANGIDERFLPSDSQSNYDGESVRTKEEDYNPRETTPEEKQRLSNERIQNWLQNIPDSDEFDNNIPSRTQSAPARLQTTFEPNVLNNNDGVVTKNKQKIYGFTKQEGGDESGDNSGGNNKNNGGGSDESSDDDGDSYAESTRTVDEDDDDVSVDSYDKTKQKTATPKPPQEAVNNRVKTTEPPEVINPNDKKTQTEPGKEIGIQTDKEDNSGTNAKALKKKGDDSQTDEESNNDGSNDNARNLAQLRNDKQTQIPEQSQDLNGQNYNSNYQYDRYGHKSITPLLAGAAATGLGAAIVGATVGGVVGSGVISGATASAVPTAVPVSAGHIPGGSYNVTPPTNTTGSEGLFNTSAPTAGGTEAIGGGQLDAVHSAPAAQATGGGHGLSQGEIALIVIGAIIAALLITAMIALLVMAFKRYHENKKIEQKSKLNNTEQRALLYNKHSSVMQQIDAQMMRNSNLEMEINNLENLNQRKKEKALKIINENQNTLNSISEKIQKQRDKLENYGFVDFDKDYTGKFIDAQNKLQKHEKEFNKLSGKTDRYQQFVDSIPQIVKNNNNTQLQVPPQIPKQKQPQIILDKYDRYVRR